MYVYAKYEKIDIRRNWNHLYCIIAAAHRRLPPLRIHAYVWIAPYQLYIMVIRAKFNGATQANPVNTVLIDF